MNDTSDTLGILLIALVGVYLAIALVGSIFVAQRLEKELKARQPGTLPYQWGFFFGCTGIASAPLGLLTAVRLLATMHSESLEMALTGFAAIVWLALVSICGLFIIGRKQWAWILGTVLTFNPVLWIAHAVYAGRRWGEFAGRDGALGPDWRLRQFQGRADVALGTEEDGYKLMAEALKLERAGRVQDALAAYAQIARSYSHTEAGRDAQKTLAALSAKVA